MPDLLSGDGGLPASVRRQNAGAVAPDPGRARLIGPSQSVVQLDRYQIFVTLYSTAFVLEMVEYWTYPLVAVAAIGVTVVLLLNSGPLGFLCFLVGSTGYFLIHRVPEVANHVNLLLFCNVTLIAGLLHSWIRRKAFPTDGAFFEAVQPALRLMIVVTFAVAGFHKLNYDFLNPAVSCVSYFSLAVFEAFTLRVFGLPVAVVLGLAVLAALALLRREVSPIALPRLDRGAILLPALAALLLFFILFAVAGRASVSSYTSLAAFAVIVAILCWQLIEGPLLLLRRFQWFALCMCLVVHMALALVGFADFQALAIALLMTFLPEQVLQAWNRHRAVGFLGAYVHRAHAFFAMNLAAGLANAIDHRVLDIAPAKVLPGVAFDLGLLILLWPILKDLFSPRREWRWDGVTALGGTAPKLLYVFPVLLILFGLTSYFGLRTAGNFSMFSNLRTELGQSNHLLLRDDWLKIAGYQEDVVNVLQVDDEAAEIGYQYHPLTGYALPLVEFQKLVVLWRKAGRVVPMRLEYGGKSYDTDNIVAEPDFQIGGSDWEMKLLDFRVIQLGGPNDCRW